MLADVTSGAKRIIVPLDFRNTGTAAFFQYPFESEEVFVHPSGETVYIDLSQAWYWTDEWQAGERKVDEYIDAGNFETFDSMEEFLNTLGE